LRQITLVVYPSVTAVEESAEKELGILLFLGMMDTRYLCT